jgi:hypothetical protein
VVDFAWRLMESFPQGHSLQEIFMQIEIASLWLPILLSGVLVFIASSLVWMLLQYHNSDWSRLPDEEAARAALKGIAPGEYRFPYAASNEERKAPLWLQKVGEGPNGMLLAFPPGQPQMGKQLGLWLVYCLVISFLVAYVCSFSLRAGAQYLAVFRLAGTVAVLAYAGAVVPGSIWFGHSWSRTFKDILDGLIYGLLTGGVFGWLWP